MLIEIGAFALGQAAQALGQAMALLFKTALLQPGAVVIGEGQVEGQRTGAIRAAAVPTAVAAVVAEAQAMALWLLHRLQPALPAAVEGLPLAGGQVGDGGVDQVAT